MGFCEGSDREMLLIPHLMGKLFLVVITIERVAAAAEPEQKHCVEDRWAIRVHFDLMGV